MQNREEITRIAKGMIKKICMTPTQNYYVKAKSFWNLSENITEMIQDSFQGETAKNLPETFPKTFVN